MNKINENKTPRAAQSREKTTRRKPWAPPSSLDAPPAPDGFKYRWIRAETLGQADNKNLNARLREGFRTRKSRFRRRSVSDNTGR
jgi:hypothetical protein